MKLNPDFIVHKMDGETVLIPTANAPFHGLIQGNESKTYFKKKKTV